VLFVRSFLAAHPELPRGSTGPFLAVHERPPIEHRIALRIRCTVVQARHVLIPERQPSSAAVIIREDIGLMAGVERNGHFSFLPKAFYARHHCSGWIVVVSMAGARRVMAVAGGRIVVAYGCRVVR
jgi:hypothetical protein